MIGTQSPVTGRRELVCARLVEALLLAFVDSVVVDVLVVGCRTMPGDEPPQPASPTRPTTIDADKTETVLNRIVSKVPTRGAARKVRSTHRGQDAELPE